MNARRAAKAAFSVAGALQSRGSDPEAGDDGAMDADAGAEPKKPLSKGLIIGLVAVVVLVLTLLAFFIFWDFSGGPTGEGDGTQDPVPVETGGGAEVSAPSSSGE